MAQLCQEMPDAGVKNVLAASHAIPLKQLLPRQYPVHPRVAMVEEVDIPEHDCLCGKLGHIDLLVVKQRPLLRGQPVDQHQVHIAALQHRPKVFFHALLQGDPPPPASVNAGLIRRLIPPGVKMLPVHLFVIHMLRRREDERPQAVKLAAEFFPVLLRQAPEMFCKGSAFYIGHHIGPFLLLPLYHPNPMGL